MRGGRVMLGLAIFSMPASVCAGSEMTVATFLSKADALKAKGFAALLSPDVSLLKSEVRSAGAAYRNRISSDKKYGNPAHSCPPKNASMASDEFINHLRSYAADLRSRTTITVAFFDLMKKRYPCK